MRVSFVALAVAACGFHPQDTTTEPPVDAFEIDAALPPVTCGSLTCDPHALCTENPATCSCASGYTGDGFTCADIDECMTGNGGCAAACLNTSGSFLCYAPQTCADVTAKIPTFHTGSVTLFLGGMANKPWTAYCDSNKEYLTLPAGNANNYGQYTHSSNGSDVRTKYAKVRLHPDTLRIDICDQKFATSTGQLFHTDGTKVTSMPFGVAMDCAGNHSNTGVAHIDLTGTPFAINDTFILAGFQPNGSANPSNGNRVVAITAGGNCGYMTPDPGQYNPFNTFPNADILDVSYSP